MGRCCAHSAQTTELPSRPRVSPHAHHTHSPPAACESARTARASPAPLALGPRLAASARSPLHRARHVCPSPHAVLGGGLCGTPSNLVTRTREGRGSRVNRMALPTSRTITVNGVALTVITFIDRRAPNAQEGEFLPQFQLERLLFGNGPTGTTGAFYRLLQRAGVGDRSVAFRRASVADGLLSAAEFDNLKVLLDNDRLRVFTLVPLDAVQSAITTIGPIPEAASLLTALEMPRPDGWPAGSGGEQAPIDEDMEEEGEEGGEEADSDGIGDGVGSNGDQDRSGDRSGPDASGSSGGGGGGGDGSSAGSSGNSGNSAGGDGQDEAQDAYATTEVVSEPDVVGASDEPIARRRPVVMDVSPALESQLQAFQRHRIALVNRQRKGKAVASVTAADDRQSLLHFFGWVKHAKGVRAPSFQLFANPRIGVVVQEFIEEKEQTCQHARIAKLIASLVSAARFIHTILSAKAKPGQTVSQRPLDELLALHAQVLSAARQEAKFSVAVKPKGWLDWAGCQRARLAAETMLAGQRAPSLDLTRDVCLLKVLTGLPPDRVGVYRQLQLGGTLKSTEGGYQLDLSLPGQHKTASVFGPAITTVTDGVARAIAALVHIDSLTTGEFLFHATDRASHLNPTQWGLLVKEAFLVYGGTAMCPKDCRASFITWLRSGEHCDDVLTSSAKQMRHSSTTSASATYDKEKAARVVSAASKAADVFARQFA